MSIRENGSIFTPASTLISLGAKFKLRQTRHWLSWLRGRLPVPVWVDGPKAVLALGLDESRRLPVELLLYGLS